MTKEILLSSSGKGRPSKRSGALYALVDDEDYNWLNQWNWTAVLTSRKSGGYASRNENGSVILMHRLIMDAKEGEEIDHVDGRGLNNQRGNLRHATRRQGQSNRGVFKNNKVGYKGVSMKNGKFRMVVSSMFDTAEEAALAFDKCSTMLYGEYARLNFPAEKVRDQLGTFGRSAKDLKENQP